MSCARCSRRGGVVQPLDLAAPPDSLALNASARSGRHGDLWWRTTNSLCLSSGARLLMDLQAELGISQTNRQSFWGRDLFPLLTSGFRSVNPGLTVPALPTAAATTVSREWIQAAIWYTYHRAEFPTGVQAVTLPGQLALPGLGAEAAIGGYSTATPESLCLRGFTRELPMVMRPTEGGEFNITGFAPTRAPSTGSGVIIALVVVAALMMAK